MYKIYINQTAVILKAATEGGDDKELGEHQLVLRYSGKKKFLINVVDMLEKSSRLQQVSIWFERLDQLWSDFQSAFYPVEAAGGVVFRDKKALVIYRRGHWDLPKGKIEKGERPEQAAIREVQEETGLQELALGAPLKDTWHVYSMKDKRILKTTHWYIMRTSQEELHLQHEEDIEAAKWVNPVNFFENPGPIYGNILDVLVDACQALNQSIYED
jgi:8-oxo-dGTP pyrophosphatase MutT (NUDIX family)